MQWNARGSLALHMLPRQWGLSWRFETWWRQESNVLYVAHLAPGDVILSHRVKATCKWRRDQNVKVIKDVLTVQLNAVSYNSLNKSLCNFSKRIKSVLQLKGSYIERKERRLLNSCVFGRIDRIVGIYYLILYLTLRFRQLQLVQYRHTWL
jgi:hypothetical protein